MTTGADEGECMRTKIRSGWSTLAAFMIATVAVCFSQGLVARAQTPEPAKPTTEVEQLKQRLQQLEQTVLDLKGQINAIEDAKKQTAPAVVEAKYTEPPAAPAEEPAPASKPQQDGKGE